MVKPKVPTITAEDVAKGDVEATARAAADIARLVPEAVEEAGPKPHKHYYPKGSDTCACGHVRKTR